MTAELFWRFLVVSALAFGGGQATVPLVERIAVAETGWLSARDFAAALAFSYITPGPVLILATFIGYRAAGLGGALAATVGVFLLPWALAAAAAWQLQYFLQHPRLRGFGRGAAPAVVGLLGVTALSIGRQSFAASWGYALVAVVAAGLALRTKVHPFLLLIAGSTIGFALGA